MMRKIIVFCFILIFHPLAMGSLDSFLEVLSGPKTHYEILGVPTNCSRKDIKERFDWIRKMVMTNSYYLTDKEEEEIERAYNILRDPVLRAIYDAWIKTEEYQKEFGGEGDQLTAQKSDNKDSKSQPEENIIDDSNILHQIINRPIRFTTTDTPKDEHTYQKEHDYKISQQVDALLGGDIDLNATNSLKETPFALAIQKQMLRVAFVLLSNNATPEIQDIDGDNALHLLAMEGRLWYLKRKDGLGIEWRRRNHTFLKKISAKHEQAILTLAEAVIEIAKAKGTNLLTARNNKGEQPLHTAISHHFLELAELIMKALEQEESADWNAQNNSEETYLALAIKKHLPIAVRLLLEKKANPTMPDKNGNNALHLLAIKMSPRDYIIGRNIDKNTKGILSLARDIIKIAEGANLLTARNNEGKLPVQLAAEQNSQYFLSDSGFPELVELLIEFGGAETLTEEEHNLIIQKAIKKNWLRVIQLLKRGDAVKESRISRQLPSKKKSWSRLPNFFNHLCHIAFALITNN